MMCVVACNDASERKPTEIAQTVKAIIVGGANATVSKQFAATVQASQDAELSFQVAGKLLEFPVKKGQVVKQDDLLARLDPTDFALKVAQTKARFEQLNDHLNRMTKLIEKGVVTQAQYDKAKAESEIAAAQLKLAEQNLSYTILKAPFAGTLAETYPENYQYVQAKEVIALLHNTDWIDVIVNVPENIIIDIDNHEIVTRDVQFSGMESRTFDVQYKKHSAAADPKTQTYTVYFTLEKPEDLTILPGMTAQMTIVTRHKAEHENEVIIPSTAVFGNEHGQSFVWKIDAETHRLTQQAVETGIMQHDQIKINKGLVPGDQIVLTGVHLLRENQLVKPIYSAYLRLWD